jgi:mannose-1-phosphate guanylyltransferase
LKALLLAAGEGTRLRPLTLTTPKCLVDIGGKPLLGHWLDSMRESGEFDRVIVNTHYLAQRVEDFTRQGTHAGWVDLAPEERLLGPGGTMMHHRAALSQTDFLVAHADNFSLIDWAGFIGAFRARPAGCVGTMMTFETDDPGSCGIVETDRHGVLLAMHEKVENPPGNLANAAVFLFSPEVFDIIWNVKNSAIFDISRDIIPQLLGRLTTWQNKVYHRDIGTPESLETARYDYARLFPESTSRGVA